MALIRSPLILTSCREHPSGWMFEAPKSWKKQHQLLGGSSRRTGPVSSDRITPHLEAMKQPFGRGPTTRSLGDNNDHHSCEVLTSPGMILQVQVLPRNQSSTHDSQAIGSLGARNAAASG